MMIKPTKKKINTKIGKNKPTNLLVPSPKRARLMMEKTKDIKPKTIAKFNVEFANKALAIKTKNPIIPKLSTSLLPLPISHGKGGGVGGSIIAAGVFTNAVLSVTAEFGVSRYFSFTPFA